MKPFTYIIARFYEVRAKRALAAYHAFKGKAEKYFAKAGL